MVLLNVKCNLDRLQRVHNLLARTVMLPGLILHLISLAPFTGSPLDSEFILK